MIIEVRLDSCSLSAPAEIRAGLTGTGWVDERLLLVSPIDKNVRRAKRPFLVYNKPCLASLSLNTKTVSRSMPSRTIGEVRVMVTGTEL